MCDCSLGDFYFAHENGCGPNIFYTYYIYSNSNNKGKYGIYFLPLFRNDILLLNCVCSAVTYSFTKVYKALINGKCTDWSTVVFNRVKTYVPGWNNWGHDKQFDYIDD